VLAGSAVATAAFVREGNAAFALVAAACAVYFALRLFAGLGKGNR
jgi:hypothetical protein